MNAVMSLTLCAALLSAAGTALGASTASPEAADYLKDVAAVAEAAAAYGKLVAAGGRRASADVAASIRAILRPNLRYAVVYRPAKTLTGRLSDWDDVPCVGAVDRRVGDAVIPPPDDLEVRFRCCISDKALYFLLTAKDAHVAHGLSKELRYRNDCFEVYLDPMLTRALKTGDHTTQTFVTPDDTAGAVMAAQGRFPAKAVPVAFPGGWAAEVEFPLENGYFAMAPFDGLTFGANVMYCNNDHAPKATCDQKLGWSRLDAGDNSYQTPGVYGLFTVVMPKEAPAVAVREGPKLAANRARRASGRTVSDLSRLAAERPDPAVVRGFNANASEKTLAKARAWGADSVRVELFGYGLRRKYRDRPKSALTNLVDDICAEFVVAAERCRKNGLKLIPVMGGLPASMYRPERDGLVWGGGETERAFVYLWKRVFAAAQPHKDVVWGFDVCNEPLEFAELPYAPTRLRGFYERLIPELRKIDRTSWIIFETGAGGGWEGFQDLKPLPDTRVIYSCHFYQPAAFTHQGVNAALLQDAALTPRAQEGNALRYPGCYLGRWFDRSEMERLLAPVIEFQERYRVPVYVGEFSVTAWSPVESSVQWLKDCTSVFERHGWSWSYHCIDGWVGWNLDVEDGVLAKPRCGDGVKSRRMDVILGLLKGARGAQP